MSVSYHRTSFFFQLCRDACRFGDVTQGALEGFLLASRLGRSRRAWHSDTQRGSRGTFTDKDWDQVIMLLTAARDEAQRRGLFTRRPTPLNVQDVLAVGKSA